MADDIFGAGHNRQINPERHRLEKQRRRPSIINQRRDTVRLGHRDDCGHVLHFKGQAAGAFHENGAGKRGDQRFNGSADARIIINRLNAEAFQQPVTENSRWIIGAVGHQQLITGTKHRKQRGCQCRNA